MRFFKINITTVILLLMLESGLLADDTPAETETSTPMTYPVQGGKGPGMGHDYQKNTPRTLAGAPKYKGGQSGESESVSSQSNPTGSNTQSTPQKESHEIAKPVQNENLPAGESTVEDIGKESNPSPVSSNIGVLPDGADGATGSKRPQRRKNYPRHKQYGNPPLAPKFDQSSQSKDPHLLTKSILSLNQTSNDNDRVLLRAAAIGDVTASFDALRRGASPDARGKTRYGRTPLILAAANGHFSIVNLLVSRGASVNQLDNTGHTALHWAAMRGRNDVASVLLRAGAEINPKNNDGVTPLLYAVGTGNRIMTDLLLDYDADHETETKKNNMTPLLLAIEHADIEILNRLVESGVNINRRNKDGQSSLMAAVAKGRIDVIKLLLDHGADRHAVDLKGRTPIMFAQEAGNVEVINLLQSTSHQYANRKQG